MEAMRPNVAIPPKRCSLIAAFSLLLRFISCFMRAGGDDFRMNRLA
jgi:hypothetical protein